MSSYLRGILTFTAGCHGISGDQKPVRPGRRKYRSVNNNHKTFLPIFFVKQTDRQTDRQTGSPVEVPPVLKNGL